MFRSVVLITSLALLVVLAVTPTRARGTTPAATSRQDAPIEVRVELNEFSVTPSETALVAGQPYRFVVHNAGTATHELVVEPAGAVDKPLKAAIDGDPREAEIEDIAPQHTKTLLGPSAILAPIRWRAMCRATTRRG
jgi:uncharacterized cupredoxin-like copper-binding protein